MTFIISAMLALASPAPAPNMEEKAVKVEVARCGHQCRYNRMRRRVVRPFRPKLERMAYCESTGRWYISTGNGFYGGLQFTLSTWRSVGGWGYPHQNSKLEQMYRGVRLIKREGYSPWPVCGYV
jgi:hypothetical protein